MKQLFPKITKSQQIGEIGVDLVSTIVHNELQWIFRKNHNEHDFGIDGYIDIVSNDGSVTGSCIAVQIKCGKSFFKTKTEDGYTYYGERKHLNYLINHPVPIIIILCDPTKNTCFWSHFNPEDTEATKTGWKISIPEENIFSLKTKKAIENVAGPAADHSEQLEQYWEMNNLLQHKADFVSYIISREEIENNVFKNVESFFKRIRKKKSTSKRLQGKIEVGIHGYNDDPRELYEIPEVVKYIKLLEPKIKYWFFFLNTRMMKAPWLKTLMACICDAEKHEINEEKKYVRIELDNKKLRPFIERNFHWLNVLTDHLSMSLEENKQISKDISRVLTGKDV